MLISEAQQVKEEKKEAKGLLDTKLETPNANFGKQVSMPYDSTLSKGGTNQWNVICSQTCFANWTQNNSTTCTRVTATNKEIII